MTVFKIHYQLPSALIDYAVLGHHFFRSFPFPGTGIDPAKHNNIVEIADLLMQGVQKSYPVLGLHGGD